jgi:ribosomal protein L37E
MSQSPVRTFEKLPPGVTEFPNAIPRQAVGNGTRFHYCPSCGWVEGAPTLEPCNSPWPASGNRQPKTLHRCRRCNKKLAESGDCMGGQLQ